MRLSVICCIMKGLRLWCIALMACLVSVNSCVIGSCRDSFSESMWCSDNVPLGPFGVSELRLEFMRDGQMVARLRWDGEDEATEWNGDSGEVIRLVDGSEEVTLHGRYCADGSTAVLQGLSVSFGVNGPGASKASDGLDVTFVEAHLSGKTLFLLWRIQDTLYPFTTALHNPVQ